LQLIPAFCWQKISKMRTDKILIVTDDGPSSAKAIQYGFNLARDLGAKVLLLCVIEPAMTIGDPDAGLFPDDVLINLIAKTKDFLSRMKIKYGTAVETEIMAPVGDIQTTIINTAVDWNASLIIAGTHGRTGLSRLFNGSVAESIINHSPVPVCVIPIKSSVVGS